MKTEAIIYWRWSPRTDTHCASGETQLEACRRYCQEHGHTVIDEFGDPSVKGDEDWPPGLILAVQSVTKGVVLVVQYLDRLSRGLIKQELVIADVKNRGGSVAVVDGSVSMEDDDEQVLLRHMLGAVGEYAKKTAAKRTKRSMQTMQAAGRLVGGAPFGFEECPESRKARQADKHAPLRLLPIESEMQTVKRILQDHADGLSANRIARNLHKDGVASRGAAWYAATIIRIIDRARTGLYG